MEKEHFWEHMKVIKELILGGNEDLVESLINTIDKNSHKNKSDRPKMQRGWQNYYHFCVELTHFLPVEVVVSLNDLLHDHFGFGYEESGSLPQFFIPGKSLDSRADILAALNIKLVFPAMMERIVKREHVLM